MAPDRSSAQAEQRLDPINDAHSNIKYKGVDESYCMGMDFLGIFTLFFEFRLVLQA
jgi:hypothetical protein